MHGAWAEGPAGPQDPPLKNERHSERRGVILRGVYSPARWANGEASLQLHPLHVAHPSPIPEHVRVNAGDTEHRKQQGEKRGMESGETAVASLPANFNEFVNNGGERYADCMTQIGRMCSTYTSPIAQLDEETSCAGFMT